MLAKPAKAGLCCEPFLSRLLLYICICHAVTERQLKECARSGATSLDDIAFQLGVGTGCGRCRECASGVLEQVRSECACALAPVK